MEVSTKQSEKDGRFRWSFVDADGTVRANIAFRGGRRGARAFATAAEARGDAYDVAEKAGRDIAGLVPFTDNRRHIPTEALQILAVSVLGGVIGYVLGGVV